MALADQVEEAKERQGSLGEDKRKKMEEYRQFRQRMIEAGLDVEGHFTIPLMQRIGHGYSVVVSKRHKVN
ncbi:MAG: hypothetical protein OXD42_05995 [Rhodospirillaceae bacterium]|nr:hypothetical protein [Rhodospirillaceae bacterium]